MLVGKNKLSLAVLENALDKLRVQGVEPDKNTGATIQAFAEAAGMKVTVRAEANVQIKAKAGEVNFALGQVPTVENVTRRTVERLMAKIREVEKACGDRVAALRHRADLAQERVSYLKGVLDLLPQDSGDGRLNQ